MQDAHDLEVILDSQIPLIVIESHEEARAIDLLLKVARRRKQTVSSWSITEGLKKLDFGLQMEAEAVHIEPEAVLEYIKDRAAPGFYILCDFHHWLEEHPKNIRLLKDIAQRNTKSALTVFLLSHLLQLPKELARQGAQFKMTLPNEEQIFSLIKDEAKRWGTSNGNRKVTTNNDVLQKLVSNLVGLTHSDVRRLARGAIVDDGAITETDIPEVNRAKFDLMDLDGVLSYEYDTEDFASVGGMDNLKNWLAKRRVVFEGDANIPAADFPKGLLLLGVQGCGKSLAAKATAGMLGIPILRLDMGALYNKFYGETERNLRDSLELADKMSPCVLWVDEIEKGISSDINDSGTSQRVLGTLLTWMAERTSRVFVVATANDVSRLPPEIVRKGRLDELFFADLPDTGVRENIFQIHLQKRELDLNNFDTAALSRASEGFTGAEIEQAVVSAVYSALAQKEETSQNLLLEELGSTSPLSVVMSDKITSLRVWAEERNVVRA